MLEEIGFRVRVFEYPVVAKDQYNSIFNKEGSELEVHFVPADVGPTNPNARPDTRIAIVPHVRVHSIKDIPITELRQHLETTDPLLVDLGKV
jgi:hypothetical protein